MVRGLCMLLAIFMLSACGTGKVSAESEQMQPQKMIAESETDSAGQEVESPLAEEIAETAGGESLESGQEESALKLTVGDHELLAAFADNSSAEAFRELLAQGPLAIEMEDYGGFEEAGPLGTTLTRKMCPSPYSPAT